MASSSSSAIPEALPMPMGVPQKRPMYPSCSSPAQIPAHALTPITFIPCQMQADGQPQPKRRRLVALKMTPEELKLEQARLVELRKQKEMEGQPMHEGERARLEEERSKRDEELRAHQEAQREAVIQQKIARILAMVKAEGLTLDRFWLELLKTKDPSQASWVSRTLTSHGTDVMQAMLDRKPKVFQPWMRSRVAEMHDSDRKKLSKKLRASHRKALTAAFTHLQQWNVMEELNHHAPALWEVMESLRNLDCPVPTCPEDTLNQNDD